MGVCKYIVMYEGMYVCRYVSMHVCSQVCMDFYKFSIRYCKTLTRFGQKVAAEIRTIKFLYYKHPDTLKSSF